MMPRSRVDVAIDHAAARMTDAQPSDALTAKVLARVAAESTHRFPWRWVFAGGAVAGVGVVAMVAAGVWRDAHVVVTPLPVNVPAIESAKIEAHAIPTEAPERPSPLPSIDRTARVERAATEPGAVTVFPMSAAEREWRARATPALDGPGALEIRALETRPIDITPLGVAPLTVPALGDIQNR